MFDPEYSDGAKKWEEAKKDAYYAIRSDDELRGIFGTYDETAFRPEDHLLISMGSKKEPFRIEMRIVLLMSKNISTAIHPHWLAKKGEHARIELTGEKTIEILTELCDESRRIIAQCIPRFRLMINDALKSAQKYDLLQKSNAQCDNLYEQIVGMPPEEGSQD